MRRAMHIFYKDLNFHHGLHDVAQTHRVLPVFLWSEKLNQGVDTTPSLGYRLTWARLFNRQLLPEQCNLLMVYDVEEIVNLAILYRVDSVTMLRHYEPAERDFQLNLETALKRVGIALKLYPFYTLQTPESVLKQNGQPYAVFTPYYKKWRQQLRPINRKKRKINWLEQPVVPNLTGADYSAHIEADFIAWQRFLAGGWRDYLAKRDFPAADATSHLSALINHGVINVYDVLSALLDLPNDDDVEAFIRQLAWRDFFTALLYHHPDTVKQNYNKKIEIDWLNCAIDFQTWCAGNTGYPFVDAAMRDLYRNGRLPNRLRMVVAGFLTKDLLIDWREGARWFKEHLVDYDMALNVGGWQWAASTGADAVPYFRVFNPTTQSQKFDPAGEYIRRHLAQLQSVDDKKIHFPQKYGVPYIERCVDHAAARKHFLNSVSL